MTAPHIKNYTKAEGLALEDHYIASAAEMKRAAALAKELEALAERKERALAERARLQKKAEMSEPRNRHGRSNKDRRKMMDDVLAMFNKRGEMTAGDIQARLKVNSDEVKSLISSLIYRDEIYSVAKLQGVCIYRARPITETAQ